MFNRKSALTSFGAILGLALAVFGVHGSLGKPIGSFNRANH